LRDEDGAIDSRARRAGLAGRPALGPDDAARIVADMHEADLGALLEALDPDERPRLISLLGAISTSPP
jgi:magnesium transporter